MATWNTEDDIVTDLCEYLNDFSTDSIEVNETYWMKEDSNDAPEKVKPVPTTRLSTDTPTNSTAAVQKEITYNILSDMSKANIELEPDYMEILKKKNGISSKEPSGFVKKGNIKKSQKWKPMTEVQEPNSSFNQSACDWQPVDLRPFTVMQQDFPTLQKK